MSENISVKFFSTEESHSNKNCLKPGNYCFILNREINFSGALVFGGEGPCV